jgi:tripartite-type tricarboxylate transporter receptor subunit TctC
MWRSGVALLAPLLAAAGLFPSLPAEAKDAYPSRAVKVVVPAAAGSTTDILARLVAEQLNHKWNKPVIVVNVSGGAMNIGAEQVARSPPDGYTLLVSPPSPIAFNHLLYRDLAYDPRSFVTVAALARVPNVLVARKDLPASSARELIAHAKANPGKVTYASQGAGSTAHLSAAQLEMLAGIEMVHVPYRGAQPALNDLIGGHVDIFFDTVATSTPLFRAGKIKILGIASPERLPALPDVVTIAESALPGFRSVTWFALVAPPKTPRALVEKINRDVVEGLGKPEVAEKLGKLMLEPIGGTPAAGAKFIADEAELWGKVIREQHIEAK